MNNLPVKKMAVLHNNANREWLYLIWKIYYYELVTGMDFGSEMLSVDHADISKRDIGNNRCISWAKRNFFQSRDCVCLIII
jgi:hypothetical protein